MIKPLVEMAGNRDLKGASFHAKYSYLSFLRVHVRATIKVSKSGKIKVQSFATLQR